METIESGIMTKGLAALSTIENKTIVDCEAFTKKIAENLEKKL